MKHFNIIVRGSVQGVGFRHSARIEANKSGITGFVRNQPDGTVYIEAEGSDMQLHHFITWCEEGFTFSRVERVIVMEGIICNYTKFEVRI